MTEHHTPQTAGASILLAGATLIGVVATAWLADSTELLQQGTLLVAAVSLCASCGALLAGRRTPARGAGAKKFAGACCMAALVAGASVAVVLALLVAVQGRMAAQELLAGPSPNPHPSFGFSWNGLAAWSLVTLACGLQVASARNWRLITPLFWLAVVGVIGLSMMIPVYLPAPAGAYARSAWALVLAAGLAAVLGGFVIAQSVVRRALRARWLRCDPQRLLEPPPHWPAFRQSCTATGLVLILLVCYHLACGGDAEPVARRLAALAMACSAGAGAAALLVLLGRGWSVNLADIGMGLVCAAGCCVAVAALPDTPAPLSQRFPLILNALLVGLALLSWLWNWLSCVWRQQLDAGAAWTTAGELIVPATRMAFVAGGVALAAASLMAVWPRWAQVAAMDHSIGRLVAGVAGHLLLLWAVLWGARRVRQARFTALAVLAVTSLLVFVYVRTVPHTTGAF